MSSSSYIAARCPPAAVTKEGGERTAPTIEPYSVRRTRVGELLRFGVKVDTGESRSYRVDRIRSSNKRGVIRNSKTR